MASSINARSYAKINRNLKILGKREDGYHEIKSDMQFITLHDTITIATNQGKNISVEYLNQKIPHAEKDDLCYRAAALIGKPVKISIFKRIPIGAGLGGGSSNAATVLMGIRKLYNMEIDLMLLGEKLGCDVPFFLNRHSAIATGTGTKLFNKNFANKNIILIASRQKISTTTLYQNKDLVFNTEYKNDFQPLVILLFSELADIFHVLKKYRPTLTGTGSALFITHTSSHQLTAVKQKLKNLKVKSIITTRTCNKIQPIKGE